MTADIRTAGAASHAAEGWHTINWKSAYRIVCRLQARIVKAIQEGRWGKVTALQYLLTHSFSGKAPAIRRVTRSKAKGLQVRTGRSGTPRRRKRRPYRHCDRGATIPNRQGACTYLKRTARCVLWDSHHERSGDAGIYLQALDPIAETMAHPNSTNSGRNDRRQTPSSSATSS